MKCTGFADTCTSEDAVRYRMRTQYAESESNFAILCPDCQKICDEYWDDLWEEYYRGLI